MSVLCANLLNIIKLFVLENNSNNKQQLKLNAMETTFEKLNDQEMINVIGGDKVVAITDSKGNTVYVIIKEGPVDQP